MQAYNPSTHESEAEVLPQIWGQLVLHSEFKTNLYCTSETLPKQSKNFKNAFNALTLLNMIAS